MDICIFCKQCIHYMDGCSGHSCDSEGCLCESCSIGQELSESCCDNGVDDYE